MKMYTKYLVLFLVSSTLFCSKKEIGQSVERPMVNHIATIEKDIKKNPCIDTLVDTSQLQNNKMEEIDSLKKVSTKKKGIKKVDSVTVGKLKEMVIFQKDECDIEKPETMGMRERPNTLMEAEKWAQWMYKKAKCYEMKNIDSCFYYTQLGIKTFENGSLFYLKALCLLQSGHYSSAKTAAEISLSRIDHWIKNDKEEVLKVKIEALKGLQKSFPSTMIEKEINSAQNAYNSILGN